ncbi:MAG TPA: hypothetical protein PKK43_12300 [Spirochaetota bacterium]|nr:hypothetical protein [Spirochaetota bacterium]
MNRYFILLFASLSFVSGCASSGELTFLHSEKFSLDSNELAKSAPLDRFDTHEIYLVLDKPETCIRIDAQGFVPKESIAGGEHQLSLYWILERQLPGKGNTFQYTEISRNFDSDWKASASATFCSRDNMPIERLVPGTYRLRMTLFRKDNCRFSLTIFSNVSVTIKKFPGGY